MYSRFFSGSAYGIPSSCPTLYLMVSRPSFDKGLAAFKQSLLKRLFGRQRLERNRLHETFHFALIVHCNSMVVVNQKRTVVCGINHNLLQTLHLFIVLQNKQINGFLNASCFNWNQYSSLHLKWERNLFQDLNPHHQDLNSIFHPYQYEPVH